MKLVQDTELESKMKKVNEHISEILKSEDKSMQRVMDWVLQSKGKQLRPRFLLLAAGFGEAETDATECAAIIEIVHMASLVHDDIIDEAELRRNKTSVYKKFGKKLAVYAGDYMVFAALTNASDAVSTGSYRELCSTMKELCNGELGQNANLYNMDITKEQYLQNITGKTASMFELACRAGALVSNAEEQTKEMLAQYGKNFGILFQLRDDLMDYGLSGKMKDKPIYQDFVNGIYTMPVLNAVENSKAKRELKHLAHRIRKNGFVKEDMQKVEQVIRREKGFEKCNPLVEECYSKAKTALQTLSERKERAYLEEYIDTLYSSIKVMIVPEPV